MKTRSYPKTSREFRGCPEDFRRRFKHFVIPVSGCVSSNIKLSPDFSVGNRRIGQRVQSFTITDGSFIGLGLLNKFNKYTHNMGRFENSDEFTCLFKISVSRKWNVVCNETNQNNSIETHRKQLSSSSLHLTNTGHAQTQATHKHSPAHAVIYSTFKLHANSAVSRVTAVNHLQ